MSRPATQHKRAAYPAYKPSGVAWLGDVPEHWEIRRLKYSADLINTKIDGAAVDLPYTGLEHIESWTGKRISPNGDVTSEGQANLYGRGDVLFGKLRPYLAKAHAAEIDGICTGELLVLRPKAVKQKFLLNYILNPDFVAIVDSSTYGAKMPRANWDFIGNLPALIPPQDEQRAIAAFLDRETARIDALIEKKRRQIELLQEKRSALISHAVTKGLSGMMNDECGMMNKGDVRSTHHSSLSTPHFKDSGIEWLGEIPEHWEVRAIRRLIVSLRNGTTATQIEADDNTVPVSRIETISDGTINFDKIGYIEWEPSLENFRIRPGDILLSHINSISMVGNCALFDSDDKLYNGMNVLRLRPNTVQLRI